MAEISENAQQEWRLTRNWNTKGKKRAQPAGEGTIDGAAKIAAKVF
jgi:hypothetical protein